MSTKSIWLEGAPAVSRPPLRQNQDTDVCIVGAGIAGLSAGYFLAQTGRRVLIVDKGGVGGGESLRTTGHLTNMLDSRYFEIASLHGEDAARKVAESHTAAIRALEEIIERESIDCSFQRVPGFLVPGPDGSEELLKRELDAVLAAGIRASLVDAAPLLKDPPRALRVEDQAQFDPGAYLAGLARAFEEAGGSLFCGTRVTSIEAGQKIRTDADHLILANQVVLASSTPFNDMFAVHTKQSAFRTYAAAYPISGRRDPSLLWDTATPYHYVRLHTVNGQTYLIAGGEDHKTGLECDHRPARLDLWVRENFDTSGGVEYFWSGQILEPVDKLAFIGRNPSDNPNVYIVSGTSGNGLTYGAIAGLLIRDLILNRENPWEEIYNPSRVTLRSTPEFIAANANVVAQYTEWVTPGDVSEAEEISPGCGAIVRQGTSKVAVYHRPAGGFIRLSAVCPHVGCLVAWNPHEETWDCPCHGSRFTPEGEVLNGPASKGLAAADVAAPAAAGQPT
jgi:glycine/D-amino acid oxidase-like deaminating enzyme/nitrite reductase/ring-hydroxylating ferredoxin subunit